MERQKTGDMASGVIRKPYSQPKLTMRGQLARITASLTLISNVKPEGSDVRLKDDIRVIGNTAHGLPLYTFRYHGKPEVYEGVMAQDVLGVMPDAVVLGDDGYLRVNYEKLGVTFRRVH